MSRSLATLPEAIEWTQAHWHENRVAPAQINQAHVTDGALGGLRFSTGFARTMDARPNDTTEDGVNSQRYRYPMWRALVALENALRPRRQAHPYALVLDLAEHRWDARVAAASRGLPWNLAEALYLRALRQLHGRYQQGPISVSWIAKSESQRTAEVSAA